MACVIIYLYWFCFANEWGVEKLMGAFRVNALFKIFDALSNLVDTLRRAYQKNGGDPTQLHPNLTVSEFVDPPSPHPQEHPPQTRHSCLRPRRKTTKP